MRKWTVRVALAMGALLIVALTFALGGLMGFSEGYAFQLGHSAPTDAIGTVQVLEAIRRGDSSAAIQILETVLDARVAELYAAQQSAPYWFALWMAPEVDNDQVDNIMRRVAGYRQQHQSDDAFVRDYLSSKYAPYTNRSGE